MDTTAAPASHVEPHASVRPSLVVRLAIVLAITTAYIELIVRLVTKYTLNRQLNAGHDVVWMAPLSNVIWLGCAAIAAIALRRFVPSRTAVVLPLTMVFAPAVLAIIWLYPKIHLEAGVLLAVGLAVQASRMVASRLPAIERLLRRWAPSVVVGALMVSLAVVGWFRVREWRAMAALPASPAGAPNVLLLILDTVRSFNTSTYGYGRETTPVLSSIATDATLFDRAFVTASWTLPSHATMFTARWPNELSASLRDPLDDRYPTLAEAMTTAGFATGTFAANHSFVNWEFGLARGFIRLRDYPVNARTILAATSLGRNALAYNTVRRLIGFHGAIQQKSAAEVNEEFVTWLDGLEGKPFFAFLNYFDAHHPYVSPEPYLSKFGPPADVPYRSQEPEFAKTDPDVRARLANQYDGAIAYIDDAIGELLDTLDRRQMLDNTVVIITSDHGEHWGDHKRLSHGNSMYRQLLQVPLLIRYPRAIPGGRRIRTAVTLRDLPATVLELTGVVNRAGFAGSSLTVHLDSARSAAGSLVFATNATLNAPGPSSVVGRGMHYIQTYSGNEELYDLENDSLEEENLAADAAASARLAELRALLAAHLDHAPKTAEP
jgi:arylsulfatase A-like enzyme